MAAKANMRMLTVWLSPSDRKRLAAIVRKSREETGSNTTKSDIIRAALRVYADFVK